MGFVVGLLYDSVVLEKPFTRLEIMPFLIDRAARLFIAYKAITISTTI